MDDELQQTVESLLGPGVKVLDCEKKSCLREEEVLLVNGVPIALEGKDGAAIREALLNGTVPHCDLLNQILIRAGILKAPVRLETSLSVKSSVVTREEVTVARGGRVVDERSRQTQEDNFYESSTSEVWEPMGRTTAPASGDVWEPISVNTTNGPEIWQQRPASIHWEPARSTPSEPVSVNSSNGDNWDQRTTATPDIWEPLSETSSRAASTNRSTEEVWEDIPSRTVKDANTTKYYVPCANGVSSFYIPSTAIDYSKIPAKDVRAPHQYYVPSTARTASPGRTASPANEVNGKFVQPTVRNTSPGSDGSGKFVPTSARFSPGSDGSGKFVPSARNLSPGSDGSGKFVPSARNLSPGSDGSGKFVPSARNLSPGSDGSGKFVPSARNLSPGSDGSGKFVPTSARLSPGSDGSGKFVPTTARNISPGSDANGKFVPLRGGAWMDDDVDFSIGVGVKGMNVNGGDKKLNGYVKVPGVQATTSDPMIFDAVTSQHPMPDSMCRRSLPQTPQGSKDAAQYNGAAPVHEPVREVDNTLVYREGGNLVSGPLEALVQHMVPTADYYPDRAYLFAFLLSSRLFIKPHELLGEVCALCDEQQRLGDKHVSKERLGRFVPHLVQLLAEWTETFPYDFRDERVMTHVRAITQKCVAVEPSIRRQVSTLLQNLLHRLTTLEAYEAFLARSEAAPKTVMVDVSEVCTNSALLAQQLTHVELERLSYIGPEEFVQAFAKDSSASEPTHKDAKKTRNLESYVQWFNRLSYLVATQVCKHVKKKLRVKMVDFWIETARECFNIGNFNSLMAIIAGLNISPVSRLKKTWNKVAASKFAALEHQMDPSSNFSSYRSTLKAAMWRSAGATDERQRIVIPFFSLLVKDLYFLNEGCANKLPSGHINFEKFWQLAKQVTEFITWKQVTCPFEKNAAVITFLQTSPILAENALALSSFECEAPDNSSEKERFKLLKAELNG